jgi:nicotinamidase-related amidase
VEHAYGLEIPQTLEEACDPRRVALIVYDMQVGILSQLVNGGRIVAQVAKVLEAAHEAGVRVFFMRHMSLPKEVAGVFQLRMAMAWQRVSTVTEVHPWFLRDSPGFPITPELDHARARRYWTRSRCQPSRARRWTSPCATAASTLSSSSASAPR